MTRTSAALTRDNNEMLSKNIDLTEFVARRRDQLPTARDDRDLVAECGMVLSSLRRHLVAAGDPDTDPGDLLPDHRDLCVRLTPPDLPPREVVEDYVHGPGFLDSPAENLFKTNVAAIGSHYDVAHDTVAALRDPAAWTRADTGEALHSAARGLEIANHAHRDQARRPDPQKAAFRDHLRGFYQPLPLRGQKWEGINAAHVGSVVAADPTFGTTWPGWEEYADQVTRHMLHSGQATVRAAANDLSLIDAFRLAVGANSLDDIAPADLNPTTRSALVGLIDLLRRHAAVGNAHVGVIRSVLRDDPDAPTAADRANPVEFGSGGRTVEFVIAIAKHRTAVADDLAAVATRLGLTEHRQLRTVRRTA